MILSKREKRAWLNSTTIHRVDDVTPTGNIGFFELAVGWRYFYLFLSAGLYSISAELSSIQAVLTAVMAQFHFLSKSAQLPGYGQLRTCPIYARIGPTP
ncbi:MAG TPA: hypothetical protein VFK37_02295 [Bacillales bacterium]|nr:hypothetical protein [Bacillales bacterium]